MTRLIQKMPEDELIVSSQILTYKKHWWSRKSKKLIVMTSHAIYELEDKLHG